MTFTNSIPFNTPTPEEIQQPNYIHLLKVAKYFMGVFSGGDTVALVTELGETLAEMPISELLVKQLKSDEAAAEMIQERYMAKPHNLEELLQYPKESLGYLYASNMKARGFRSEDLYASFEINSDVSYVNARVAQTHDIWHIITGFSVSLMDEVGLQAFYLTQFHEPLSVITITASLIYSILIKPEELPPLLNVIAKGMEMGQKAQPLFAQKWEENWEKPLSEWQTELNIQPVAS